MHVWSSMCFCTILAEKHVHDTRAERFMANLVRTKQSKDIPYLVEKGIKDTAAFMTMFVRTKRRGIASNTTDRLKIEKQLSQLSVYAKILKL